jgi:murein L,D-transpeptidase YafK
MIIRILLLISISILLTAAFVANPAFRNEQKRNARVKSAYNEKWKSMKGLLTQKGIDTSRVQIFIRGFKKEGELELWAKHSSGEYKLVKTYEICASSGVLGPKRKQGDLQVPEGFYTINVFNPYSAYHLSLGVSYPNQSDRIIGGKGDLGGAIMIHGNCVTIGCIPLTDDKIKEVYVLAVETKANGFEIPVHLFPARLSDEGMSKLEKDHDDQKLVDFWKNLKLGYDHFEKNKKLPKITIAKDGKYVVS